MADDLGRKRRRESSENETEGDGDQVDEDSSEDSDEEVIGPMPVLAARPKKKKVLQFERLYLNNLPCSEAYEQSFMHRDVINHTAVTSSDFVITASIDGHVKFWKKQEEGIEFVKHFRAHLGAITDISVSSDGSLLATAADDKSLKIFDVVNFDMINMMKIGYVPVSCEWIFAHGQAIPALACADRDSPTIYIYDGRGSATEIHKLSTLHSAPCTFIAYNVVFDAVVSGDQRGMLEYWTGPALEYEFPKNVSFEFKTETDLYELAKSKTTPYTVTFSPNGQLFAVMSSDRMVRVFKFATGKLYRVFDETLRMYAELQQANSVMPSMDYGRRMATERELEKAGALHFVRAVFDESSSFLLCPCILGIKVINLVTNKCLRIVGKQENIRILHLALYQGRPRKSQAAVTIEMQASDNPMLLQQAADPVLVCTAYKKNRFYLFSRREPDVTKGADNERDVFNEKPSREEQLAATQGTGEKRLSDAAVLHTTMGDIFIKLFMHECPKTVENFCVHSLNGYYNNHIFHRVIKSFMIQTGDPTGTGSGGESIWGGEFEDEINPKLRHDRAYTLSMANAGQDTNGSQFFITVVPTPWLDGKHTVFGRVTKGMEVVQSISEVKTHPKTDKPYEDVKIVSVTVK